MRKGTPCLLIDKKDGTVAKEFRSVADGAKALGICRKSAWTQVSRRAFLPGRYMLRLERDWEGSETFERNRNRPIIATDGERWRWFADCTEASGALRVMRSSVHTALSHGVTIRGLTVRYATSTRDWPELAEGIKGGKQ